MSIATDFVYVKPLKPFCGSYETTIDDADHVNEVNESHTLPDGSWVSRKRLIGRKRFFGAIKVERAPYSYEIEAIQKGEVSAGHLELVPSGARGADRIIVHPLEHERIVKVPREIAESLVNRGLAELIEPETKPAARRKAA